ncbi:MAG: hypothetical protein ACMUHU_00835 [Thermoplasmatota archaeon]
MEESSPIPDTIPVDEMGNLDVGKEMEFLEVLGSAGLDTEGMKDLLFTDIDGYRQKREQLVEFYNNEILPDIDRAGMDIEAPEFDEDLLLYGAPISEDHFVTGSEDDISLSDNIDGSDHVSDDEDLLDLSSDDDKFKGPDTGIKPGQMEEMIEASPTADDGVRDSEGIGPHGAGRRDHRWFYYGITIFIALTLIGVGSYLYLSRPTEENGRTEELTAEFRISDMDPIAGSVLNLSAEFDDPDAAFKWEIIPGDYRIVSGRLVDPSIEVYFTKPETYRIDLRVIKNGEEVKENKFLGVGNRQIAIERERYGDNARYDVLGHLTIENVDDMIEKKDVYVFETLDVDFWTEKANPMTMSISQDIEDGKDGLGVEYARLERRTDEFLRFSGSVSMKSGENPTVTGHTTISQQNHVDLFNQRTFRTFSDTTTHVSIPLTSAVPIDYDMEESMMLYPSLDRQSSEFRIEDIKEDRNISIGEEGIARWGPYDLTWSATEVEIIFGRPSLMVTFLMDQATKRELDIEEFRMVHWISSDIPASVRMVLNATTRDNIDHPTTIDLEQEMVGFTRGDEFVIYGSSQHRHETLTRVDEVYPGLEQEFSSDWDMIPGLGGFDSSIPTGMAPVPSLDLVLESREYALWSSNKDDLTVSYSNFSRFGGRETWGFNIVEPEEEWGWKANVTNNNQTGFLSKVTPISISRSQLGFVLSFSGGEYALKELLYQLDRASIGKIYGKAKPLAEDDIRLNLYSISTRVDHPYPRVGLVDPSLGGSIPYCMVVESFDGTLEVGLDMTNGQIAYVQTRGLL